MSAGEKERAHHPYTNHHHHKHLSHSHIANYHWHCRFCCCCCCKHQHISRKTTPSFPQKDEMSATWWLMVIKRIQICVLIDICTQDASLALVVPFSLACSLARSLCSICRCGSRITIITLYTGSKVYGNNGVHCHYHSEFDCLTHSKTGRTNNKKL